MEELLDYFLESREDYEEFIKNIISRRYKKGDSLTYIQEDLESSIDTISEFLFDMLDECLDQYREEEEE